MHASLLSLVLVASSAFALPVPGLFRRSASAAVQAKNAADAQALNAQFKTLTAASSCTDGETLCVSNQVSQCVGGKIQVGSACAGGTQCLALPLVNSPGTSVACDTEADAISRIKGAGGSASLTGTSASSSGSSKQAGKADAAAPASRGSSSTGTTSNSAASDFLLQNAKDAQALNKKFETLTAGSSCTDGDSACVNGDFAQCVAGKFQVATACSGGSTCVALPLVNSAGTSVTCDSKEDAIARIQSAGGSASLTG